MSKTANGRGSQPSSSTTENNTARVEEMIQYSLFSRLKEHISGGWFPSDSSVKTSAEIWLYGQGPDFY
ncbi:hypothetical protein TNCV_1636401 [Trichonephila clavipes]|uniref:Uncharacterized protein n=1 Tax=Trichonephila clavipes TaxID=2585209 RepID=A0A8X6RGV8_TRICX|nr:hypothetical protein TNCV_1636401 [Trichonephila clavipes]